MLFFEAFIATMQILKMEFYRIQVSKIYFYPKIIDDGKKNFCHIVGPARQNGVDTTESNYFQTVLNISHSSYFRTF